MKTTNKKDSQKNTKTFRPTIVRIGKSQELESEAAQYPKRFV